MRATVNRVHLCLYKYNIQETEKNHNFIYQTLGDEIELGDLHALLPGLSNCRPYVLTRRCPFYTPGAKFGSFPLLGGAPHGRY